MGFLGKKGELLTENLIFIILNLAFVLILAVFIFRQSGGGAGAEEFHAKQIALILDSAKPGMEIEVDLSRAEEVDSRWFKENFENILSIEGNNILVKFSGDGGHEYSFFNNLDVDSEVGPDGNAFIVVRGYQS